ncbi:hypothetical protein G6O67_006575 [Ophiocordyceps sinensis]|uniref:FAD-binding domain-containing protein n=1 Tax=Ophiocordyceps sinensis TaxID=72228 RepID=A0A8H4LWE2_9HYPO|nr:hypothetical protein G6O67_006575 [Ophiocordyceps sinensis]
MDHFKVMIVGGSVAGLTLANLLERLGIDFIVLEARAEIASCTGTAIVWQPSELRILQRLGCVEDMLRVSTPFGTVTTRTGDGCVLYSHRIECHFGQRYDAVMTDGHKAVRALYNNLGSKNKVLTGQRVAHAEHVGHQVRLYTDEGRSFQADIAIGADGIHGIVGQEMQRMAMAATCRKDAALESSLTFDRVCMHGKSSPTGDLKASQVHLLHKKDVSCTVVVGLDDTPYWYLTFKLAKAYAGHRLPRCPRQYERALVAQEAETLVTFTVRFKQLYDNALFSHTASSPSHVMRTWHLGRFMVMGGSAHKSAAALADNLSSALAKTRSRVSMHQIEAVFTKTTALRPARSDKTGPSKSVSFGDGMAGHPQPGWLYWLTTIAAYLVIWLLGLSSTMPGKEHRQGAAIVDEAQLHASSIDSHASHAPTLGLGLQRHVTETVVLATWTIESFRIRNRSSPTRAAPYLGLITTPFGTKTTLLGAGAMFLVDSLVTGNPRRWRPTATFVPRSRAKALLPVILSTGTLVALSAWLRAGVAANCVVWALYPVHLCFWQRRFSGSISEDLDACSTEARHESLAHLRRVYILLGLAASSFHLAAVYHVLQSREVLVDDAPCPLRRPLGLTLRDISWDASILSWFLLAWNLCSVLAVGRAGIRRVRTIKLLLVMSFGSVVIGPEATAMCCSYWTESSVVFGMGQGRRAGEGTCWDSCWGPKGDNRRVDV